MEVPAETAFMYGAVVVEPREGYPTKADREYVVIQSEFYAKPRDGRSATALHEHGSEATAWSI